ncbi:MAG: very short patch repair endonuclease [Solirubrobacterales bacterium]
MDKLTPTRRSENMRRIRGKDTGPEVVVRRALKGMGVGYRLHVRDLPGSPDIVMRGRRLVLFVHGCFWHQHEGCPRAFSPATRREWWSEKFERNKVRDNAAQAALRDQGWRVEVVWECETRNEPHLMERLAEIVFGSGAGIAK